ncbi:carboxypeptidase-like regulatory domain-containing protein, partial [Singulisphaera rosea]
ATTDAEGRYHLRVGPGIYQLHGPTERSETDELTVRAEEALDHDFHIPRHPRLALTGRVLAGGKPLGGAIVRGDSIGENGHSGFEAVADDQGRFRTERWNEKMLLAARGPDGTLAGIATIEPDTSQVEISVTPAATVRGRVVDAEGRPMASVSVFCRWGLEPQGVNSGLLNARILTDDQGRYKVDGVPAGIHGEIAIIQKDYQVDSQRFTTTSPAVLEQPDLVARGAVLRQP